MEPLISDALPSLVEQVDALVPTLLKLSGYDKSMVSANSGDIHVQFVSEKEIIKPLTLI